MIDKSKMKNKLLADADIRFAMVKISAWSGRIVLKQYGFTSIPTEIIPIAIKNKCNITEYVNAEVLEYMYKHNIKPYFKIPKKILKTMSNDIRLYFELQYNNK